MQDVKQKYFRLLEQQAEIECADTFDEKAFADILNSIDMLCEKYNISQHDLELWKQEEKLRIVQEEQKAKEIADKLREEKILNKLFDQDKKSESRQSNNNTTPETSLDLLFPSSTEQKKNSSIDPLDLLFPTQSP